MIRLTLPPMLVLFLSLVALPGLVLAQQPGQMDYEAMMRKMQDPAAMQRMAQEAQAAQQCMEKIDEKKLDALQKRAEASGKEIRRLCDAGKKDAAREKALAVYQEMKDDPTLGQLRECAKGMTEMIKSMPWAQMPGMQDESDPSKDDDVCS